MNIFTLRSADSNQSTWWYTLVLFIYLALAAISIRHGVVGVLRGKATPLIMLFGNVLTTIASLTAAVIVIQLIVHSSVKELTANGVCTHKQFLYQRKAKQYSYDAIAFALMSAFSIALLNMFLTIPAIVGTHINVFLLCFEQVCAILSFLMCTV